MKEKEFKKLQRRVYVLEQAVEALLERDNAFLSKLPAFNDQRFRKELFTSIIAALDIDLIVETGTKWGNTTTFLAETCPETQIFSSELIRESFLIAQERSKHYENVKVVNIDSRKLLKQLSDNPENTESTTFFYLDAHWYDDLPLIEEIEIIANNWEQFVVMIDDFEVPHDDGYGFDDYGSGKCLNLQYLNSTIEACSLEVLFPSTSSETETGSKRGCVILSHGGSVFETLSKFPLLKRIDEES